MRSERTPRARRQSHRWIRRHHRRQLSSAPSFSQRTTHEALTSSSDARSKRLPTTLRYFRPSRLQGRYCQFHATCRVEGDLAHEYRPQVDEAHHSAAKSYRDILKLFDPRIGDPQIDSTTADDLAPATILAPSHPSSLEPPPDPPTLPIAAREDGAVPIIGFTATFDRADGLALGSVYEKLVYHARWVDMIGNWLSDLTFHSASIEALDLDSVQTSSGDFSTTSLAGVMSAASVIGPVVQAWTELASERRSTVVFAVDLRHMELLAAAFVAAGVADARSISSKTPVAERNRLLADFRRGAFRVLVNVGQSLTASLVVHC